MARRTLGRIEIRRTAVPKTLLRKLPLFAAAVGFALAAGRVQAGPRPFWITPATPGYGAIHLWPHEVSTPRARAVYKAVFYIPQRIPHSAKPDPELGRVARMLNVFVAEGVPLTHLRFVVVFDGGAIPAVLRSAAYGKRFHGPNPNVKLLGMLAHDGVALRVCGVALAGWGFRPSEVLPEVGIAPTGPSTLIVYENHGYALVPF